MQHNANCVALIGRTLCACSLSTTVRCRGPRPCIPAWHSCGRFAQVQVDVPRETGTKASSMCLAVMGLHKGHVQCTSKDKFDAPFAPSPPAAQFNLNDPQACPTESRGPLRPTPAPTAGMAPTAGFALP